jgi:uncharacterized protein (TIGR02646 family)
MRRIKKGKEPKSLTKHRLTPHANYENYPAKDELRISLYKEQRGICCYCMCSISPESSKMKIEHYYCQENNQELQLIYWNILGACKGNEGQPLKNMHCDSFKGQESLSCNPVNQDVKIEDLIWYRNDGTIGSPNHVLDQKLNEVLNLNLKFLKNNRKAALDGFKTFLEKKHKGTLKRPIIERWLDDWNGDSHKDNLKPYCQVIVYWLQKKLKINKV